MHGRNRVKPKYICPVPLLSYNLTRSNSMRLPCYAMLCYAMLCYAMLCCHSPFSLRLTEARRRNAAAASNVPSSHKHRSYDTECFASIPMNVPGSGPWIDGTSSTIRCDAIRCESIQVLCFIGSFFKARKVAGSAKTACGLSVLDLCLN